MWLWRNALGMTKRKPLIFALIVLMTTMVVVMLTSCNKKTTNLISNGNFEQNELELSSSVDNWEQQIENSVGEITYVIEDYPNEKNGKRYAYYKIENSNGGQVYSKQPIKLKKGKTYKISADFNIPNNILAPNSNTSYRGAHIGFVEVSKFEGIDIKEKTNGWETKVAYFKNDYDGDLTLRVGIGSVVMGLARGEVKIDNISVEEVSPKTLPANATIQSLSNNTLEYKATAASKTFVWMMGILSLLLVGVAGLLIFKFKNTEKVNPSLKNTFNTSDGAILKTTNTSKIKIILTSATFLLSIIIILAFVIRFLLMYFSVSMVDEVNKISAFTLALAKYSPVGIYNESKLIVPFGMMYLDWFIGLFANAIGMTYTSWGLGMLIRIPGLIADLITILFIFKIVDKYFGKNIALVASGLFGLSPVFFMANASMLYNMPIAMLFIVSMFYGILDRKPMLAIIMFNVAWMFEYYVLLFLPILIYFTISEYLNNPDTRISIPTTYISSFAVYWILDIPFSYNKISQVEIFHVFTKQGEYFKTYEHLSFDTFNLYSIFWKGNTTASTALTVFGIIFVMCIVGFMVYAYFQKTNRADTILLSSFLLISMGSLGTKATPMLYVAGLLLLLIYIILVHDIRLFGIFAGFSTISVVNMGALISNAGILSSNHNKQYTSFKYDDPLLIVFSIFTVILTIYFAYVSARIILEDNVADLQNVNQYIKNSRETFKSVKSERLEKIKNIKEVKVRKIDNEKNEKEKRENYGIKKDQQKRKKS